MKTTVVEAQNYPIPEDTLVPLKLESVTEEHIEFVYKQGPKEGTNGLFIKWEWTFVCHEGEYAGLNVRGNSEPRFTSEDTPSGNLALARPWAEALLGRVMQLGESIDTDDLIGLSVQATVKHLPPRQKKDGEGFWFNVELDECFPAGSMADMSHLAVASDPWQAAGKPPF